MPRLICAGVERRGDPFRDAVRAMACQRVSRDIARFCVITLYMGFAVYGSTGRVSSYLEGERDGIESLHHRGDGGVDRHLD